MSGVKSVAVDFGAEIKSEFSLQVDSYPSQVTIDHGLHLWELWYRTQNLMSSA